MRAWVLIAIFSFLLVLNLNSVSAGIFNHQTESGGNLLASYPDITRVNEESSIKFQYFFLNQKQVKTDIQVYRQDNLIFEEEYRFENGPVSFWINDTLNRSGVYPFEIVIVEVLENQIQTAESAEFDFRVLPETSTLESSTETLRYLVGSSQESYDLSTNIPFDIRDDVEYKLSSENPSKVQCDVIDSVLIINPTTTFEGLSICEVRATYEDQVAALKFNIEILNQEDFDSIIIRDEPEEESNDQVWVPKIVSEDSYFSLGDELIITYDIPSRISPGEVNIAKINIERIPWDKLETLSIAYVLERPDGNNVGDLLDCDNLISKCEVDFEFFYEEEGDIKINFLPAFEVKKEIKATIVDKNIIPGISNYAYNISKKITVMQAPPDLARDSLGVVSVRDSGEDEDVATSILNEYKRYRESKGGNFDVDSELERIKNTEENIEVTKELIPKFIELPNGEIKEHTTFNIKISLKNKNEPLKNVDIYEHISKEAAEDISHIQFKTFNENIEIVNIDPLVVWHFEELDEDVELEYEVDKKTTDRGNTIVAADFKRKWWQNSILWSILAIVLIPLVAVILIYFDKFRPNPEQAINDIKKEQALESNKKKYMDEAQASADAVVKDLETYILKRLDNGHFWEDIKTELVGLRWPDDILEHIFDKHKHKYSKHKK